MLTQVLRHAVSVCVLSGLLALSVCLASPVPAQAKADVMDLYLEAMLDGDVQELRRLLAPNFVFIGSNGHVQDKEHFLETIRTKKLVVKSATFKNMRETSAGPVRLVTGNGTFEASSDVALPTGLMRISLVADCTKADERLVLVQLTPVVPTRQCKDGNCLIR